MYRSRLLLCAAFSIITTSALPVRSDELKSSIDRIFSSSARTGSPGAAVAVMREGETIFKAAYGVANLKTKVSVTTGTAFHLASVGKHMTSLAILMLEQEGLLSIDDSVTKYLPQFKRWGSRVTLRTLMEHTSGVPDYYDTIDEAYRRPTNVQAVKYLASLGFLDFPPGTRFEYSNSGYDTLGAIVGRLGGKPFAEFMHQRVFGPAGMVNSFAFDAERVRTAFRATGYTREDGQLFKDDSSTLNSLHGSGSIYSSVEDMIRYDAAYFGARFVSQKQMDKVFTSGRLKNGTPTGYGLGWELLRDDTLHVPYYGHSGEWMGFSSYYLHYPGRRLSVVVLLNLSNADPETLAVETAHAVIAASRTTAI